MTCWAPEPIACSRADVDRSTLVWLKERADERCPGVYCVRNPVSLETRLVEPARVPGP